MKERRRDQDKKTWIDNLHFQFSCLKNLSDKKSNQHLLACAPKQKPPKFTKLKYIIYKPLISTKTHSSATLPCAS